MRMENYKKKFGFSAYLKKNDISLKSHLMKHKYCHLRGDGWIPRLINFWYGSWCIISVIQASPCVHRCQTTSLLWGTPWTSPQCSPRSIGRSTSQSENTCMTLTRYGRMPLNTILKTIHMVQHLFPPLIHHCEHIHKHTYVYYVHNLGIITHHMWTLRST